MSESHAHLLDQRVLRWINKQGWAQLRDIQEEAIPPILSADRDVLISASTAAGKTEAFFLPACSLIADQDDGFGILYISPLKALINDQTRRLEGLSDVTGIEVTPWHGDVSASIKKKSKYSPSGILLITPESLESLLVREPGWVVESFSTVRHIVIDEFHAFLGTERGQHLLSLLNRIDMMLDRYSNPIPRTALSATLGELDTVPALRPSRQLECQIITGSGQSTLKVQVQGYINELDYDPESGELSAYEKVCQTLFRLCRGDSHLIFANSRQRTEELAVNLTDLCNREKVPNEFFPHHGSLSKEFREDLEKRLQQNNLPTTAVCTMTLELGIDIGKVNSVFQVTAPHSISSLRQRVGRSGRRGTPSTLRMLITENEVGPDSDLIDHLRIEMVQSMAMIRLLIASKWFEPADDQQLHFSTLLHQILAVTAQWGGVRADQLHTLLCKTGPFQNVSVDQFKQLLVSMGKEELLTQTQSGELVLGIKGEKVTGHYSFYSVFNTPKEYRVTTGEKVLGMLPIDTILLVGQHIVFAGRRWEIEDIDEEKSLIQVKPAKGGKPPKFGGGGMNIHEAIRREMRKIYLKEDYRIDAGGQKVGFADATAEVLFHEGVACFRKHNLGDKSFVAAPDKVYIFTWLGDKAVNSIVAILISKGFIAGSFAGVIEVKGASEVKVKQCLIELLYCFS